MLKLADKPSGLGGGGQQDKARNLDPGPLLRKKDGTRSRIKAQLLRGGSNPSPTALSYVNEFLSEQTHPDLSGWVFLFIPVSRVTKLPNAYSSTD
jgi:hypothetical protein